MRGLHQLDLPFLFVMSPKEERLSLPFTYSFLNKKINIKDIDDLRLSLTSLPPGGAPAAAAARLCHAHLVVVLLLLVHGHVVFAACRGHTGSLQTLRRLCVSCASPAAGRRMPAPHPRSSAAGGSMTAFGRGPARAIAVDEESVEAKVFFSCSHRMGTYSTGHLF